MTSASANAIPQQIVDRAKQLVVPALPIVGTAQVVQVVALAIHEAEQSQRERFITIVDRLETEWRDKGWEDEATAACDIAAALIKATA